RNTPNSLGIDLRRALYLSLVRSTLCYGGQVWAPQASTRDLLLLERPNLTKTSTFRDSYFNRIIPLWNSLPLNTKESTTLSSFKTKVRSHYKSLLHSAFDPDRIRTLKTICSKC
ncbi:hypothetical protein P5673_027537, partial [Acropora cervicornis]